MIKFQARFFSAFSLIIFIFFFVLGSFVLEVNSLTTKQNDKLMERIANDFSKKFCNGVGFGLSQESAENFAMEENMAIFRKKKGIANVDSKTISEKISKSVFEKCAYPISLSADKWELSLKD